MQSGNPVLTLDVQPSCAFDDDSPDRLEDIGLRIVSDRSHRREAHSRKLSRTPHPFYFEAASAYAAEPHAAVSAS